MLDVAASTTSLLSSASWQQQQQQTTTYRRQKQTITTRSQQHTLLVTLGSVLLLWPATPLVVYHGSGLWRVALLCCFWQLSQQLPPRGISSWFHLSDGQPMAGSCRAMLFYFFIFFDLIFFLGQQTSRLVCRCGI